MSDPLAKETVDNNIVERLDRIERLAMQSRRADVTVQVVSDISNDLGEMRAGDFLTASDGYPDDGSYTGCFMSQTGYTYDGTVYYHVGGVKDGGLQFGLSAEDGKAYFAGGNAVIDSTGIIVNDTSFAWQQTGESAGGTMNFNMGMFLDAGGSVPSAGFQYSRVGAGELVTNGGGESGTVGWTEADGGLVYQVSSPVYEGSYSLKLTGSSGYIYQRINISPLTTYNFTVAGYIPDTRYSSASCELVWYNSGTVVVRTDTILFNISGWKYSSSQYQSPSTAVFVDIKLINGTITTFYYPHYDSVSLSEATVANELYFEPASGNLVMDNGGVGMWPRVAFAHSIGMTSTATLTLVLSASYGEYVYYTAAGNAANGDVHTYYVPPIEAGTYKLIFEGAKNTDRGKIDWTLDGVSIATGQDWYGTSAAAQFTVTDVTVAKSGTHTLVGTMNGKNASSGDYEIYVAKVAFVKTA